jgi:ABC-type transporter Mla subunit MlaD
MAVTQSYEHYRLSHLSTALAETAGKESLNVILTKLDQVDEKLADADNKYLASNGDFRSGQQALSNRLDAVEALAKQATDFVEQLDLNSASAGDLMVIKASLDGMASQLKALQTLQSKSAASKPPPNASIARKTSVVKAKTPTAPPPFDLIGIEYRGEQEFLAIAPRGSTQLSQINLIRPGDAVIGTTWKLNSLDGASASFDVAGTPQTLALAP